MTPKVPAVMTKVFTMAAGAKSTKMDERVTPLSAEKMINISVVVARERFSLATLLEIFHTSTSSAMMMAHMPSWLLYISCISPGDIATL